MKSKKEVEVEFKVFSQTNVMWLTLQQRDCLEFSWYQADSHIVTQQIIKYVIEVN